MEDSPWGGIILALIMIGFMFLPNYLFKPPANHEEIREKYIRNMIKLSEAELDRENTQSSFN